MNAEISALIGRAGATANAAAPSTGSAGTDAERLRQLAAEFESMLLVQMLKEMRRAGRWDGETEDGGDLHSLFETLDVELASYLARAGGIGLSTQMLDAFERMQPATAPEPEPVPVPVVPPVAEAVEAPSSPPPEAPVASDTSSAPALRPVRGKVTSDFGWRRDPFTNGVRFHSGVDLRAAYGEEVRAAGAGTVVFSGDRKGYGTSVVIEHQDGTQTLYAHLAAALVRPGDQVGAGDAVGQAGSSGRATGPHLHFEVIAPDGQRVAPEWGDATGFKL